MLEKIGLLLDIRALIVILLAFIISIQFYRNIHKKPKNKLNLIGNMTQNIVLVVTLIVTIITLSDLKSQSNLGAIVTFFLVTNLYASLVSLSMKLFAKE